MLAAIRKRGHRPMRQAADELRKDRDFVLQAVRVCGAAVQHADLAIRSDFEVVLEAVRNGGSVPYPFSEDDPRLQRDAVHDNPLAIAGAGINHCSSTRD